MIPEKIMLKQKLERDDVSTKFPLRDESVSPARASVRRGDDRQERHQEEKTDAFERRGNYRKRRRPDAVEAGKRRKVFDE